MAHKESEMTAQFSLKTSDDILMTSQVFKMMTYQVSQKRFSCLRKQKELLNEPKLLHIKGYQRLFVISHAYLNEIWKLENQKCFEKF